MQDRYKFRFYYKPAKLLLYPEPFENLSVYIGNDNCIPMQCTGLKDKNGRLIYEGDIIKDKLEHIRVCVYEDDRYKYPALKTSRYFHKAIKNKQKNRCEGLLSRLTFQDNLSKNSKSEFEIIGNIYENEGLLKEVK